MKRCLLVGAAPSAHKELDYILQTQGFDAVYAVDGGFAALQERGIVPDAVFGDFDSLGAVPQHPCVFEYDMHKDFTDMDLAIGHAEQQGLEELVICDAFTGRLPRQLAVAYPSSRSRNMRVGHWRGNGNSPAGGTRAVLLSFICGRCARHVFGAFPWRCVQRRYRSRLGVGARRRNLHEPGAVGYFQRAYWQACRHQLGRRLAVGYLPPFGIPACGVYLYTSTIT